MSIMGIVGGIIRGVKVIYSSWRFATANTTLFFRFCVFSLFSGHLDDGAFSIVLRQSSWLL